MQQTRPPRPRFFQRTVLLVLTLLSACAAAETAPPRTAAIPAPEIPQSGTGALLVARFALSQQDMDTAATAYIKALAADPDNVELRQQAFLTNLLANTPEAAGLARSLPQNQAALLVQANDAARTGNWMQAEARFAALQHQGLFDLLRPMLIAWAEAGAGRPEAAQAILRPLADAPNGPRALYALHAALIADFAGQKVDTNRLLRITQNELGGSNLEVIRLLAGLLAHDGRRPEAERLIRSLLDAGGELPLAVPDLLAGLDDRPGRRATDGLAEVYFAGAAALRGQEANDFSNLIMHLALDMNPDLTTARLLAAELAALAKRPENGLKLLKPVQPTDRMIALVRFRRALLLDASGNTAAAITAMQDVARLYPDRPEPLARLGSLLRSQHKYPEAVAAYDRAVALIPHPDRKDWPIFYERGTTLERAHDWPRAEQDLLHALDLAPDQPFVLNYLGYSWAEMGRNLPRARQMIERAAALRPNDGAILDSLGWIQLRQGDISGAVKQLEHAAELEAADPTINGHLGDAYWAAGRKLEAQFQWRRALTLNPESEDVAKLEQKLRNGPPPTTTP